jgi:tRNA threonylcarbamoyladenosine biosynthesis protein TsaE
MRIYQSFSSAETRKIGYSLARKILRLKTKKTAVVIALLGELGSGKTTFTQGFFRGLGTRRRAQSPSFIIIRRIPLKTRKFKNIFHIDAYRIMNPKEVLILNLRDIFADPENIVIIEWADKVKKIIPKDALWIKFNHSQKLNERIIEIQNFKIFNCHFNF